MARAPKIYRKLPGHGATLSHRVRLYLGPDHLLQVSSTGFTETYRRFYFRDMQSITIRTTIAGRVVNAIFGGFVAIFATLALVASGVGTVVLGCFAVLFAIVLGANVALGPTAMTRIRTAVQEERLPSLSRAPRARRVLARIRPLIAEAQGELSAPAGAAQETGLASEGLPPVASTSG